MGYQISRRTFPLRDDPSGILVMGAATFDEEEFSDPARSANRGDGRCCGWKDFSRRP